MLDLNQLISKTAVIGAAGKMGSGISLLMLQEMAITEVTLYGQVGDGFTLQLIDNNEESFPGLLKYLRTQLTKFAEKNIGVLRKAYSENINLIENGDMIHEFILTSMSMVRVGTNLAAAANSHLIFEAVFEKLELKKKIYCELRKSCADSAYFLTNTSSIPISEINKAAGLNNRIIGFHFYNPPAIQKLVEIISDENTEEELQTIAKKLGKRLRKILVPSRDIAGFIGNGHFIRDGLYAIGQIAETAKNDYEAIYMLNKISQDFMVRPMGIFQLIDYVGIDVFQMILKTMNSYINESLQSDLIDAMMKAGIRGGQFSNGSQKDGFLKYEEKNVVAVYSLHKNKYIPIHEKSWLIECDKKLGNLPSSFYSWGELSRDKNKVDKLKLYFADLAKSKTFAAQSAMKYLKKSFEISQKLVDDNVAATIEDVGAVLKNGFYHIYNPGDFL